MHGLPFSVKKPQIVQFFGDFKNVEDRIHIACRTDRKATGEAYVEFAFMDEAKRAMCKDKMTIGSRYVELFPSTPDEARRAESRSRFMIVFWGSVLIPANYSIWNCHRIKEKASRILLWSTTAQADLYAINPN
ncbi:hypothetical protein CRYUN_Cryun08bG0092700 [Craigia yunnanensis]